MLRVTRPVDFALLGPVDGGALCGSQQGSTAEKLMQTAQCFFIQRQSFLIYSLKEFSSKSMKQWEEKKQSLLTSFLSCTR